LSSIFLESQDELEMAKFEFERKMQEKDENTHQNFSAKMEKLNSEISKAQVIFREISF
jgi:hypothetical protein